jgi:MFS transporter, putative metabolite:H+ symporter
LIQINAATRAVCRRIGWSGRAAQRRMRLGRAAGDGGNVMLDLLDSQGKLTWNQRKIVLAAILGDMLEFFDYFLIGYVLAFIVKPWGLTFGEGAMVLLSSGVGAIIGAWFWGGLADRIGRRRVFMATVLNFSLATGALALTPVHNWAYLTFFRFFVGLGVGGLYVVDMPLVQEFVPSRMRGRIGGFVTAAIPIGTGLGAVLGAYLAPVVGWRGLFAVGLVPALLALLIRSWVPESPRWLIRAGRHDEARRSLAWALEVDPATIDLPATLPPPQRTRWRELFQHPRSMAVSWLGLLGEQTGGYGMNLWAPTLLVLLLTIKPSEAAYLMIWAAVSGFVGRIAWSYFSEFIGRRVCGMAINFGAALTVAAAGIFATKFIGAVSLFWLFIVANRFFGDGGFAVLGPYSAEVWPAGLRSSGMGSAYGFASIGKIIGPLGLALIIGSSNVIKPEASIAMIGPAFLYLAGWMVMSGIVFFFAIETKGRTIEEIDQALTKPVPAVRPVEVKTT